ncbi:hypothetical protein LTR09_003874 [Extremus antarcticus]|uniref:Xylanolytic transcriptional activator regulatory domain-containing protein n=1 Tax=Extremus antarcticus TaxID=702011 RepID=A0AAJ0DR66_9PEZI|nr:hypothetical protein LTR09_003874 [Extremus antarcticus]
MVRGSKLLFNVLSLKDADAVPKKRGPKTDVLEALVKRVNGLKKQLKDEAKPRSEGDAEEEAEGSELESIMHPDAPTQPQQLGPVNSVDPAQCSKPAASRRHLSIAPVVPRQSFPVDRSESPRVMSRRENESIAFTDALLDTYFARIHSKPYYILDEANTRQRLREGHLPQFMIDSIHAVAIRYVPHLCGGYSGAVRTGQDYAAQARAGIDVDEPSIDNLQALLLLAMAQFQAGKGKKSYMLVSHAISMAFALDLHREVPSHLRVAAVECEGRRKLFWTCYLMDRFTTSGSKRPAMISGESISLRYPAYPATGSQRPEEGIYFPNASSTSQSAGHTSTASGSAAVLVEIVRILGVTNRYLASGGVKGDPHFPWHAHSTLSRIRADLDKWAASTHDAFASLERLFGQQDSVSLVLSKLVYHLVHCLLYRPFLPVDLTKLTLNSQNQSWQIEATNLCFMHANAIVELVDIGKATGILYWPSFVGYCVCTAGTIHIHGAHYVSLNDNDVFSNSSDFLSREMAQLADQSFIWAGVNHQRETMQTTYASHSRLVQSLSCSPIRFSPVFQMEDFFDRYPNALIDGAHMSFTEVQVERPPERHHSFQSTAPTSDPWPRPIAQTRQSLPHLIVHPQAMAQHSLPIVHQHHKKRRLTEEGETSPYPIPTTEGHANPFDQPHPHNPNTIPSQPHVQVSDHFSDEPYDFVDSAGAGSVFSPSFAWDSDQQNNLTQSIQQHDVHQSHPIPAADELQTPGGLSVSGRSSYTAEAEAEGDPFLSFLEQLAENDGSGGGPTDLDFSMTGQEDSMFDESAPHEALMHDVAV